MVVAEGIATFDDAIPLEAQELLRNVVSATLPIPEISVEKITELKQKLAGLEVGSLIEKETRVLQSLIKKLLKDLKFSPRKNSIQKNLQGIDMV